MSAKRPPRNTRSTTAAAARPTGRPTCACSTPSTRATGRNARHRASHPVPGAPAPEVATLLAHEARQHHVVHLGCAVHQTRRPRCAIDPFEDGVLGIAAGAIELNRHVGSL